jgi:hypothetical protein
MAANIGKEEAYGNGAGVAKALTTSYVAAGGGAFDSRSASEVWISVVVSGTAATSIDWYLDYSDDGGTTYHRLPAINSVAGGSTDYDPNVYVGPATSCSMGPISVPAGSKLRMSAKRSGGDATSAILAYAHLVSV